jgi:hypothetical protein
VRRTPGERVQRAHSVQHRPFLNRVMIWGCFSYYGVAEFAVIRGTMTAANYKETLGNYLLPAIGHWYGNGACIFQQDNAPCHKAESVKQFLEEYTFDVMDWPPYSPDISPIENLWAIVKRRVHASAVHSKEELIAKLRIVWHSEEIKQSCEALIEGMPRRIQAVIRARGGPTKY